MGWVGTHPFVDPPTWILAELASLLGHLDALMYFIHIQNKVMSAFTLFLYADIRNNIFFFSSVNIPVLKSVLMSKFVKNLSQIFH